RQGHHDRGRRTCHPAIHRGRPPGRALPAYRAGRPGGRRAAARERRGSQAGARQGHYLIGGHAREVPHPPLVSWRQMIYQAALAGWHDFFILAGTASATLAGLLFVGLSLHLRIVVTTSSVRSLTRVTLANFGAVLFVSLFM